MAKAANKRTARAQRKARKADRAKTSGLIVVEGVRIAPGVEPTRVSFREVKDGLIRAKPRGFPAVFVRYTEKGAEAHMRGFQPVSANRPEKAFAEVLKRDAVKAQKRAAKAKKERALA